MENIDYLVSAIDFRQRYRNNMLDYIYGFVYATFEIKTNCQYN